MKYSGLVEVAGCILFLPHVLARIVRIEPETVQCTGRTAAEVTLSRSSLVQEYLGNRIYPVFVQILSKFCSPPPYPPPSGGVGCTVPNTPGPPLGSRTVRSRLDTGHNSNTLFCPVEPTGIEIPRGNTNQEITIPYFIPHLAWL